MASKESGAETLLKYSNLADIFVAGYGILAGSVGIVFYAATSFVAGSWFARKLRERREGK